MLAFIYFFFVPAQNGCAYAIWQEKVKQEEYGRILSIQGLIVQITAILTLLISGILVDWLLVPILTTTHFDFYHDIPTNIISMYTVLFIFGTVELCVGTILTMKTIKKKISKSAEDVC
jgi:hypothetical protein